MIPVTVRNLYTGALLLAPAAFLLIVAAVLLSGCASTEPVYIHDTVEVEVPVAVPCAVEVDPPRAYATSELTRSSSDGDIVRALAVEVEERGVVEDYLRALLAGCVGG